MTQFDNAHTKPTTSGIASSRLNPFTTQQKNPQNVDTPQEKFTINYHQKFCHYLDRGNSKSIPGGSKLEKSGK